MTQHTAANETAIKTLSEATYLATTEVDGQPRERWTRCVVVCPNVLQYDVSVLLKTAAPRQQVRR
ncbi:hypothetical protein BaRGS_00013919, partial [Batillaria attramentaria]